MSAAVARGADANLSSDLGRLAALPESPTSLLTASENDSALVFVSAPAKWLASCGVQDVGDQVFETMHDCCE